MPRNNPKSRTPLYLILIIAGVFVAGAVLIPFLVQGQENALENSGIVRPPAMLNQASPSLALHDLQGDPVLLAEAAHGKVVLINNWATWCAPCRSELPELQAYYQAHHSQGFIVIAIESGESSDVVKNFIQPLGLTFPVWLDPKRTALNSFQNWDLPNSYIIDQHGVMRMTWTGSINRATLEKYVTPLLEK
jgi:cytochrome c biogenesis protein CcmG/thiol:disulfide interchange protein DsbE